MKNVPAHARGMEWDWALRSLPNQIHLNSHILTRILSLNPYPTFLSWLRWLETSWTEWKLLDPAVDTTPAPVTPSWYRGRLGLFTLPQQCSPGVWAEQGKTWGAAQSSTLEWKTPLWLSQQFLEVKSPSQNGEHHCSMAQGEAWFKVSGSSPGLAPDPSVLTHWVWNALAPASCVYHSALCRIKPLQKWKAAAPLHSNVWKCLHQESRAGLDHGSTEGLEKCIKPGKA